MDLISKLKSLNTLDSAWSRIRSNGIKSPLKETRQAVKHFDQNSLQNLRKIQRLLGRHEFVFESQKGILKTKKDGVNKRGIVMAAVTNRIVERAILDVLQKEVKFVKDVINTPSSVGGVPDRSVPHGLAIIDDCIKGRGFQYFVRSDISGFFDNVPRYQVLNILSKHIDDERLLELIDNATTVTLKNEEELGEYRKAFPTDYDGVAQGSPLSPLFGNILLKEFDDKFNSDDIVCVRFIDDFILLSNNSDKLNSNFKKAKKYLDDMGMNCHDPFKKSSSKDKAQRGKVSDGFVFLGYHILPGQLQPSNTARKSLIKKVKNEINDGMFSIRKVINSENSFKENQRFVQTLYTIDRVIHGWGDAFSYSNVNSTTMKDLDKKIDLEIERFKKWFYLKIKDKDRLSKRRALGVCLLIDIKQKRLDELPFKLEPHKRYKRGKNMITVSTDGSVITKGGKNSTSIGPGGWGAVFHQSNLEISGGSENTTNNQMELLAVIKALEETKINSRVRIRTDSRYVYNAIEKLHTINSNFALWNQYIELSSKRRVDVEWIRGHSDDPYNDRADELARNQAKSLE